MGSYCPGQNYESAEQNGSTEPARALGLHAGYRGHQVGEPMRCLMSNTVPPKQRVHRILKGQRFFLSPALRFGRPLPKGVVFSPGEEFLGGIWGSKLESILTDRGAYFRSA